MACALLAACGGGGAQKDAGAHPSGDGGAGTTGGTGAATSDAREAGGLDTAAGGGTPAIDATGGGDVPAETGADAPSDARDAASEVATDAAREVAADATTAGDATPLGVAHGQAICVDDGWCWQNPLPHGEPLYGVWGSSPKDVWTVGDEGLVAHYDGRGWARIVVPRPTPRNPDTDDRLRGVWGSGAGDVWILGEDAAVMRGDGRTWTRTPVGFPAGARAYAIWGSGPDDVWVVGGDDSHADSAHWNGTTWQTVRLTAPSAFQAIWGAGRDLVFASISNKIYRWDSASAGWVISTMASGAKSLWGSGAGDAWAVGGASILRWNGTEWRSVGSSTNYDRVVGRAADDVWLLGYRPAHWDGSQYTYLSFNISAFGAATIGGELWAVGYEPVVYRHDGLAWSNLVSGMRGAFQSLTGTSATDVWVAGEGSLGHFDGVSWTKVTSPGALSFKAIHASAANDVWGAGSNGTGRWDGQSWYLLNGTLPVPSAYQQVAWGTAADNVWIAGLGGYAQKWNGQSWQAVTTNSSSSIYAISGTGPNDVWAVGDWYVLHCAGTTCTVAFDGAFAGDHFTAVYAASKTEVWVSGTHDLQLGAGGTFVPASAPIGANAIAGRGNRPWSTTYTSANHWNGTTWAPSLRTSALLGNLWVAPTGEVFVVGVRSAILARKAIP